MSFFELNLEKTKLRFANNRRRLLRQFSLEASWPVFLKYLGLRNIWPILAKLSSRSFFLLEVGLLYQFLNGQFALGIASVQFSLFASSNLQKGFSQYFRSRFATERLNANQTIAGSTFSDFTRISITAGITLMLSLTCLIALLNSPQQLFFPGFLYLAALPLEFYSSSLWTTIYTKRRLKRRFSIFILLNSLPSVVIFSLTALFSKHLSPSNILLLYSASSFCSRSLESLYLIYLASRDLKRNDNIRTSKIISKKTTSKIRFRKIIKTPQFIYWASAFVFQMALLTILSRQAQELWFNYYLVFCLAALLTVLPGRIIQSLAMDIYLCSGKLSLKLLSRIYRRGMISACGIVLASFLTTLSLAIFSPIFSLAVYNFLDTSYLYVAIFTLGYSLLDLNKRAVAALGAEKSLYRFNLLFYSLLAVIMLIAIQQGANLSYILTLEGIAYLVFSIPQLVWLHQNCSKALANNFISISKEYAKSLTPYCPPGLFSVSDFPYLILVCPANSLPTKSKINHLFQNISKKTGLDFNYTGLGPGVYLAGLKSNAEREVFFNFCQNNLLAQIVYSGASKRYNFEEQIEEMINNSFLSPKSRKTLRRIWQTTTLDQAKTKTELNSLGSITKLIPQSKLDPKELSIAYNYLRCGSYRNNILPAEVSNFHLALSPESPAAIYPTKGLDREHILSAKSILDYQSLKSCGILPENFL